MTKGNEVFDKVCDLTKMTTNTLSQLYSTSSLLLRRLVYMLVQDELTTRE